MIEASKGDDGDFIEIVSNMLRISIGQSQPKDVFIVKTDNWFDHKWLEFSGKLFGRVGVWYEELRIPPLIPNRIIKQTHFQKNGKSYEPIISNDLHIYQSSGSNLQRKLKDISQAANFIWFSGNTAENAQASLMFYLLSKEFTNCWYVSFVKNVKKVEWQINKTKNISRSSVEAFIKNDVLALIR